MKGNEIPPNISKWLSNEATVEVALQSFYENKVNKNNKCFSGQCPDLAFNYSLGKQALKRIGICGMGGVGKTTLVKELIKTVENKLFDKVVMAVVSQNPDYEKIQRKIADDLGL
ncbi:disease resistance protein, partial [Trifolium medium]|nr:disease resistance protein [Trifolium medium]